MRKIKIKGKKETNIIEVPSCGTRNVEDQTASQMCKFDNLSYFKESCKFQGIDIMVQVLHM